MKIKSIILTLILLFTFTLVSCDGDDNGSNNGVRINFWSIGDQYSMQAYKALVDEYNATQGVIDGVSVKISFKQDQSDTHYAICGSAKSQVDVLGVSDRKFFNNAKEGYYTNLDELYANEALRTKDADGNYVLALDDISENLIDRYRFNIDTRTGGKGQSLYAIPMGSDPTLIIYNVDLFNEANINIISVEESKLDAYNAQNNTSYKARGYAEYTVDAAPAQGLKTSTNLNGETVVKVFNNLIPMNYVEVNTLSKYFTKSYTSSSKSTYGILNEWWFSHGWPVGGDCVAWDNDLNKYKFILGDENANYMAIDNVQVNGTDYNPGEILSYNDRKYVNSNPTFDKSKLYELPSQYEQFRDFCALSQAKGVKVDSEITGYGISPSPATLQNSSKITYFTSGSVAMVVEGFNQLQTVKDGTRYKFDVAPLYTFREFEGEDTLGHNELKVIGKSYDGVVFEGNLKTVNGVTIKSEPVGSSNSIGWTIPANSANKEAAWKFLQWLASNEGLSYLVKANATAPTSKSYALSDEFANMEGRIVNNFRAVGIMTSQCELGDWSYLEDGQWITVWSNELNTDVRNGKTDLDVFFNNQQGPTDSLLEKYKFRLYGKN
jgi:ABC-type glycerol-3-phosphate transport system substrate-binding protein